MSRTYLGSAPNAPFRRSAAGTVEVVSEEDCVEAAIRHVCEIMRGERPMRAMFGIGAKALLFAPLDALTLEILRREVERNLLDIRRLERVTVEMVYGPSDPKRLMVKVHYELAGSYKTGSLVHPFYTEGRR